MSKDHPESLVFQQFAGDLIAGGFEFRFQARGRSMLPTIQDGEILHVQPVITGKVRVGQIVLLRRGEEFRAHRIVRRRGESFITRGDSGVDNDGEIPRGQILGLVIAKRCSATGRTIRLDTFNIRLQFFAREIRRRVSVLLRPAVDRRL